MSPPTRFAWQPLHPGVREKLDSQYVELHDEELQYRTPRHTRAFDPSMRKADPTASKTGLEPVPCSRQEIVLGEFKILVLGPRADSDITKPPQGWPAFVWFHGGGWVLGDATDNMDLLTRICATGGCVVCSVEYRLGPEHPYPAANVDCVRAIRWLFSQGGGVSRLGLDQTRWALGGVSAGALLSAVTAISVHGSLAPPLRQILIVPVVDNTATQDSDVWKENANALFPSWQDMMWYRRLWLLKPEDATNWDASVNLASPKHLAATPPTFVAIADQDLLAPEGRAFVEQLKKANVEVETEELVGAPHAVLNHAGRVDVSRRLVFDIVHRVAACFASPNT